MKAKRELEAVEWTRGCGLRLHLRMGLLPAAAADRISMHLLPTAKGKGDYYCAS